MTQEKMMISPSSMLDIIERIEKALWDKFDNKKYQNVKRYITRWHREERDGYGNFQWSNFEIICSKETGNIDLPSTLDTMNDLLPVN